MTERSVVQGARATAAAAALVVGGTGTPALPLVAALAALLALTPLLLPQRAPWAAALVPLSAAALVAYAPLDAWGALALLVVLPASAVGLWTQATARVVLSVGWVEAARLWLLPRTAAALVAEELAVWSVAATGVAALQPRHGAVVALSWALLGLRGHQARVLPLRTSSQTLRLAHDHLLDLDDPALTEPSQALAALSQHPTAHHLAAQALPLVGVERLVHSGWRPVATALPPEDLPRTVLLLDRAGRGGEALRLAWRGRGLQPDLAWWATLLAREQGRALPGQDLERVAPAEIRRLNGPLDVDWSFHHNAVYEVIVTLPAPISGLRLDATGEPFEGPPVLEVQVCGGAQRVPVPEGRQTLIVPGPAQAGPCRIRIGFHEDHQRAGLGDRNARVHAIAPVPADP